MGKSELKVKINNKKESISNWKKQKQGYINAKSSINDLNSKLSLAISSLNKASSGVQTNYQASKGTTKVQTIVDTTLESIIDEKNKLSELVIPEINSKIDSITTKINELNRDLRSLQQKYDNWDDN